MKTVLIPFLLITITFFYCFSVTAQTIKRGRNEGTINIPASNVLGNGNINAGASMKTIAGKDGFSVNPQISGAVGFTHILQFFGQVSFPNFKTLGCATGRIQATTPFNNNLRFFGLAVSANIYLSTIADTMSTITFSGRPGYNAHIRPSVTIDLDWISKYEHLPLKNYFLFYMAETPDSLFRYKQLSFIFGTEWKSSQHSIFVDLGVGMYKEKESKRFTGDTKYAQKRIWIEPGVRYRVAQKFSLLGSLRILLYQNFKAINSLPTDYTSFSIAAEVPIVFKETNSEAIRTMLFVKNKKQTKKDLLSETINQNKKITTDVEMLFDDINKDLDTEENQKDAVEKRIEIEEKLNEIENILKEVE